DRKSDRAWGAHTYDVGRVQRELGAVLPARAISGAHAREARAGGDASPGAVCASFAGAAAGRESYSDVMLRRFLLATSLCLAQSTDRVEIERMTHSEINTAIHKQGKTTVLVYNGGTEQRGPHAVLGGHTFMARRTAEAIARKLGNALVAPVMPFSPA